ncbi:hypothetical protein [Pseudonocardia spinosispora]|uniref:hypothetical protein n=1 Tax=Pseudonocardia spinosispora TaxID=103441 RepID=UPI0003F7C6D4|nr:hypothetical protein [Pseudonocardia spinosispora]
MGTIRPGRRATALLAATLLAAGLALSGSSVSGPTAGSASTTSAGARHDVADTGSRGRAVAAAGWTDARSAADAGARPHHAIDLAFARAAWSARGDQQEIVTVRARPRPTG